MAICACIYSLMRNKKLWFFGTKNDTLTNMAVFLQKRAWRHNCAKLYKKCFVLRIEYKQHLHKLIPGPMPVRGNGV